MRLNFKNGIGVFGALMVLTQVVFSANAVVSYYPPQHLRCTSDLNTSCSAFGDYAGNLKYFIFPGPYVPGAGTYTFHAGVLVDAGVPGITRAQPYYEYTYDQDPNLAGMQLSPAYFVMTAAAPGDNNKWNQYGCRAASTVPVASVDCPFTNAPY